MPSRAKVQSPYLVLEDLVQVHRRVEVNDVVGVLKPRLQGRPASQSPMGRAVVFTLKPGMKPGVEIRKAPDGLLVQGAEELVPHGAKYSFHLTA